VLQAIALVVGVALGFAGSRQLRRLAGPQFGEPPAHAPSAHRQRASAPIAAGPVAPGPVAPPTRLALVVEGTADRLPLIDRPVTIGRAADADVTIADDRVSRRHAHLERRNGLWTVVDDGSSNGTTINGAAVSAGSPRPVQLGDAIGVGPFVVRVVDYGARPSQASGPGR